MAKQPMNEARAEAEAEVREVLREQRLADAAPDLLAGLVGTLGLLRRAQDILTGYLVPDGYDPDRAVTLLLELLDGPEQRAVETPARAAIAKATGEAG
jgi:hypothetical protein